MEFNIKIESPEKRRSGCVVVGIYQSGKLSASAKTLDQAVKHMISEAIGRGDMRGKLGTTLLLQKLPGTLAERVLLVGCGKEDELNEKNYLLVVTAAIKHLNETGATDATLYLAELKVAKQSLAWKIRQATIAAQETVYRFDHLKSKSEDNPQSLRKVAHAIPDRKELATAELALTEGLAIAEGMTLAKNLGNLPGNICTPTYLANEAKKLAKAHRLAIEILEKTAMERLGMNTLLSVSRGSREPPKFIIVRYQGGAKKENPIVLVGKGITFDSGGISLKPGAEMDEMKYDMSGAASVLGTLKAVALLKLPVNLVVVIPASENLPDGAASKPGDIVTSMSGQTVEILNTDAEGRLVLCDALTYVERFNPACVIDVATLTGACVISLGHVASGLLANHDDLAKELLDAGQSSCDRAWQLPLWDDYQDQLKSNFADIANIGGRAAGSITAACFLSRFTKKYPWAHLDIAGTAWRSGKEKGSTGRPVPLLTQFLLDRANQAPKIMAKPKGMIQPRLTAKPKKK
ncbi:MAG: leucyl aminopeptidase [Rugosibacter sp.]|nr:leucyl aminopeptidase [Rugosibacter sp.]